MPGPVSDTPRPVPELVQFWFDDVVRVEGPSGVPTRADNLSLYIDDRGMEVSGPTESYRIPWIKVSEVGLGPAETAPGGGMVRPFDVVTIGEGFRLLLPTTVPRSVRMDALEERLPGWSAVTVDTAPRPPVFAPVPEGVRPMGDPEPVPGRPGSYGQAVVPFPPSPYGPASPPPRSRRMANLVLGVVLVLAAVGLAFVLSRTSPHHAATPATTRPGAGQKASGNADRQLAERTMLTEADVPNGWTIDNDNSDSGTSPELRTGETQITTALATCMGITAEQANVVLGGEAPDQTAQATSPIFAAPLSGADPGFALQLQTAANVVRTSADQARDFSLLDKPRYPTCEATAVASELQLGANHASGGTAQPGPATATELHLSAPAGERVSALLSSFTVTDQGAAVSVEVEVVSLGSDRVEANLQAFAIGGTIPGGILDSPVAAFERRVATTTSTVSV
jgi:hypothetical protein